MRDLHALKDKRYQLLHHRSYDEDVAIAIIRLRTQRVSVYNIGNSIPHALQRGCGRDRSHVRAQYLDTDMFITGNDIDTPALWL